jgi:hypothetical protein
MFVSSIGESHNSLLNTSSHSSTSNLELKISPIALMAKGRPSHFSTICLPSASNCDCALELAWWNACFTNSDQQSFSGNILRRQVAGALTCMIDATSLSRVVTMILLPCTPDLKGLFKAFQFAERFLF